MKATRTVEFALLSDTGRVRRHNEDTCAVDHPQGLYVVCDGMGGAAAGEVASSTAASIFVETTRDARHHLSAALSLQQAVAEANRAIFHEAQDHPERNGMGTTLVAILVDEAAAQLHTVNVGDSRCYRLRNGQLLQLTHDHSFVDEQVRLGIMTRDEARLSPMRNIITRAVGSHPDVEADIVQHTIQEGDIYLLCSDGLTNELNDGEIAEILRTDSATLETAAQALVDQANRSGGMDNITVILVRV